MNLASRIEGVSKHYGATILMSEYTHNELGGELVTRELDTVRVVGKQQPIRVFELISETESDVPSELIQSLPIYESGLAAYRDGDWIKAVAFFEEAHALSQDNPSWILLERCRRMIENPPLEEWRGVWDMTGK